MKCKMKHNEITITLKYKNFRVSVWIWTSPFMNNNEARVTSFRDTTISIDSIECKDRSFGTTNLHPFITILAISTWIDISSHSDMITNFKTRNIWPNLFHYPNNLMALHKKTHLISNQQYVLLLFSRRSAIIQHEATYPGTTGYLESLWRFFVQTTSA